MLELKERGRNPLRLVLVATVLVSLVFFAYGNNLNRKSVVLGNSRWVVPVEYLNGYVATEKDLLLHFSFPDFLPVRGDLVGWDRHVSLLIQNISTPMSLIYESQFNGDQAYDLAGMNVIEREEKIEGGLILRQMGSGLDAIIPHQDFDTMPEGLMRCTREREGFLNQHCTLVFNKDGMMWSISFARDSYRSFSQIRGEVTSRMDSWLVAGE